MSPDINDTYEKLKAVVNAIAKTISPSSVSTISAGRYKIFTCKTLWLTVSYKITINAVIYTIVDIQPNEWIEVTGASLPIKQDFTIYTPFFLAATTIEQNKLMARIKNSKDKLPLIWLHDITNERMIGDWENPVERESDCELYFLIDSKPDWTRDQHKKYAILPMRALLFGFTEALGQAGTIGLVEDYDVKDHANFGVYVERGHEKKIFGDNLSGTSYAGNIPFLKNTNCEC